MRQAVKRSKFRFQLMNRLTRDAGTDREWDETLTREITVGFLEELSADEVSLIPSGSTDGIVIITNVIKRDPGYEHLVGKFDEFLVHVAGTVGPRLVLCTYVRRRMCDWAAEKGGSEKLARIGRAMSRAARIFQGLASPPLTDPGFYGFKKVTVQELKLLFQQLRDYVTTRRCRLSIPELFDWISSQLEREPGGFGHLRRNHEFLFSYLKKHPDIRLLQAGENVSAPHFFDLWIAWGRQFDPEHVRQTISRMGSTKKSLPNL